MANKTFVYLITRSDHNHHTDKKGQLHPVLIHATKELANAAAKAYLISQSNKSHGACPPEDYHGEDKQGFYAGACVCWENARHEFRVDVKKMELFGAGELEGMSNTIAAKTEEKGASRKTSREDGSDANEPPRKKSRGSKAEGSETAKGGGKQESSKSGVDMKSGSTARSKKPGFKFPIIDLDSD